MRTVFSSHLEVCKEFGSLWGESRWSREGRAGNIYFRNGKLYSYGSHFVIAEYVKNVNGDVAVLFTERGYSVSSAKHKSIARRFLDDVIYIPSLDNIAPHSEPWKRDLTLCVERYNSARSRKPEHLSHFVDTVGNIRKYYTFTGETIPESLEQVIAVGRLAMEINLPLSDLLGH
jgi:hypothetical protein